MFLLNQNPKPTNPKRKTPSSIMLLRWKPHTKHHSNVKIMKELIWKLDNMLNLLLLVVLVGSNVRVKLVLFLVLKLQIVIIYAPHVGYVRRIISWEIVWVWNNSRIKMHSMVKTSSNVPDVMLSKLLGWKEFCIVRLATSVFVWVVLIAWIRSGSEGHLE